MKIDGQQPAPEARQTEATARAEADATRAVTSSRSSAKGDRVELSADAALLSAALAAAAALPEVRTDVVDRVREKFEAGEIGKDAGTLADALMDELLP